MEPGFFLFTRDGVGTNDALWLTSTSPLRDAGDPSILDDDGSRSDIGAYGGVGAPIGVCDGDSDGHDAAACLGDDCDDTNPSVHPDLEDTWYDGVDSNCDGLDDYDQDQDGHRAEPWGGDDYDDTDPRIHPGASGWDERCEPLEEKNDATECGCAATTGPAGSLLLLGLLAGVGVGRRRAGCRGAG